MYSTIWFSWKKRNVVFTVEWIVLLSGECREKIWMYKYGTYYKRLSGLHWTITCLCNMMIPIRFKFFVHIFEFLLLSKLKSALPQHRRLMFISSGLMCLLDLPIQMIWRSVYIDICIFIYNIYIFLVWSLLGKPRLSVGVVLNVTDTGGAMCAGRFLEV